MIRKFDFAEAGMGAVIIVGGIVVLSNYRKAEARKLPAPSEAAKTDKSLRVPLRPFLVRG